MLALDELLAAIDRMLDADRGILQESGEHYPVSDFLLGRIDALEKVRREIWEILKHHSVEATKHDRP